MKTEKFSFKSRIKSLNFGVKGLSLLLKTEHNARIHLGAAIVAITTAIVLNINVFEWALLTIVIGIVFITELLNSSIENLSDFVQPEWNDMIRKAKDLSAAAVMISAIISLIVGGLLFIPKILAFF
jgi:diacylglycerol kinase (ATP)